MINCANYCSLPRRLNDTQMYATQTMTTPTTTAATAFWMPTSGVDDQCYNPSAYLKSRKKCSVDSRLRNCVDSPTGFRPADCVALRRPSAHGAPTCKSANGVSSSSGLLHHYEMSTDLFQKQVELACKRYGGEQRATQAAVIIQRAYRQYALALNFERVRKRRSGIGMLNVKNVQQAQFISKICINDVPNPEITLIQCADPNQMKSDSYSGTHCFISDPSTSHFGSHEVFQLNTGPLDSDANADSSPEQCQLFFVNDTLKNNNAGCVHGTTGNYSNVEAGCSAHYVSYVKINGEPDSGISDRKVSADKELDTFDNYYRPSSAKHNDTSLHFSGLHSKFPDYTQSHNDLNNQRVYNNAQHCTFYSGLNKNSLQQQERNDSLHSTSPKFNDSFQSRNVDLKKNSLHSKFDDYTEQKDNLQCAAGLQQIEDDNFDDILHSVVDLKNITRAGSSSYVDARLLLDTVTSSGTNRNGSPNTAGVQQSGRKGSLSKFLQQQMSPVWPRKKSLINNAMPLECQENGEASPSGSRKESSPNVEILSQNRNINTVTMKDGRDSNGSAKYYRLPSNRLDDLIRRRKYRIALNFFNKKPERGVDFLISWGFVDASPSTVAKFFITRKGLSKQMIGEYLGNLQNKFGQRVLSCFAEEINMQNIHVDVALRIFQSFFRLPGEAQKIERIVEIFADRYCKCNPDIVNQFHQPDTVFIIAFAIIMLNTDLHSPNVKSSKRMKVEDFIKNLRGIDSGANVDPKLLTEIYSRVKANEFKADPDHVSQVIKVESSLVGKKPTLSLPHRRLVCFCRVNEIADINKRQSTSAHQREIFLFNDTLLISKIFSRKKCGVTYSYRESHCLVGAQISSFKNPFYANGVEINLTLENRKLYFNARTEEDRSRFIEDLVEATHETDEMEALRIELELQKQTGFKYPIRHLIRSTRKEYSELPSNNERRNLDRTSVLFDAATMDPSVIHRHSSATSLDSGMSSTSLCSRESFPQIQANVTLSQIEEIPVISKTQSEMDTKISLC